MQKIKLHLRFIVGFAFALFCVYHVANANPEFLDHLFPSADYPRLENPAPPYFSRSATPDLNFSSAQIIGHEYIFKKIPSFTNIFSNKAVQFKPLTESKIDLSQSPLQTIPVKAPLVVQSPKKMPHGQVNRIVTAIENKFDKEKYEAFKDFAEERKSKQFPVTEKMKLIRIQQGLGEYQEALKHAAQKAEIRRQHLVNYLTHGPGASVVETEDTPYLRGVLCSFLTTMSPAVGPFIFNFIDPSAGVEKKYVMSYDNLQKTRSFLEANLTDGGLPLSYRASKEYWKNLKCPMNRIDSVLERVIVKYSVNIYDAAVWQIALTVFNSDHSQRLVDAHTYRMLSGTSGKLYDIRAYGPEFKYGEQKKILKRNNAFFFRIIADEYIQEDPLGENAVKGFPNFDTVHHEDWKPIAGEQAWAAIIGPLQVAYEKYHGDIPMNCPEMELAVSILPALRAMESMSGAIYHSPDGTYQKNPHDISNENNFSMHAALTMLYKALEFKDKVRAEQVRGLIEKQEQYFKNYAFDYKNNIFYQGGFYVDDVFVPTRIFAVDCQTWGIASLGVQKIDNMFGEGTAYHIWKNAIRRAGYYDEHGVLRGVGFTDDHRILSVEWTCGAILATRKLAEAYRTTHPEWAKECLLDSLTMRNGIEQVKMSLSDGSYAYLYANNRYFIPFGWWANPLPSLVSSSWIILTDLNYDPFTLGGGAHFYRN